MAYDMYALFTTTLGEDLQAWFPGFNRARAEGKRRMSENLISGWKVVGVNIKGGCLEYGETLDRSETD